MTEFGDVVRSRRMTRAFGRDPVPAAVLADLVDLASRAPSAGKTQGWHLVVLEGDHTERFWDVTLPTERRAAFRWRQLLDAPVIALPLADPHAYLGRYAEPDKAASGLGVHTEVWPAPYWTIDAAMAVNTLLLAAEDAGVGALFFGVFQGEGALREELTIPDRLELLGAIALGYPPDPTSGRHSSQGLRRMPPRPSNETETAQTEDGRGRSASRPRRSPDQIIHRGGW